MPAPLSDPEQDAWCRVVAMTLLAQAVRSIPTRQLAAFVRADIRAVTIESAYMNAWLEKPTPKIAAADMDAMAERAAEHAEDLLATQLAAWRYMDRMHKEIEDARAP